MRKNSMLVKALMVCVLSGGIMTGTAVYAADTDGGRGQHNHHQWRKNLTDEQRKEIRSLRDVSQQKVQPLKDQMFVKKQELKALQNAGNPDVAAVKKVAEELNGLRSQMMQERKNLGFAIDKALGLEPGTTAQRMGKGRKFAENHKGKGDRGHRRHNRQGNSMGME